MGGLIHCKVSNCYIIMKVFDKQGAVHFVGTKVDCETEQDKIEEYDNDTDSERESFEEAVKDNVGNEVSMKIDDMENANKVDEVLNDAVNKVVDEDDKVNEEVLIDVKENADNEVNVETDDMEDANNMVDEILNDVINKVVGKDDVVNKQGKSRKRKMLKVNLCYVVALV